MDNLVDFAKNWWFVVISLPVIFWSASNTFQNQPTQKVNDFANRAVIVLIAIFSGFGIMAAIVLGGLMSMGESGFFAAMLYGIIAGLVGAVLIGWLSWNKSFDLPGSLLSLLVLWAIIYMGTIGDDWLTDDSFSLVYNLLVMLAIRWVILVLARARSKQLPETRRPDWARGMKILAGLSLVMVPIMLVGSRENLEDKQSLAATLEPRWNYIYSFAFSPNGKTFAAGSKDGTVGLWEAEEVVRAGAVSDDLQRDLLEGHSGQVGALMFSPDGSLLASGADDKTILLWDMDPTSSTYKQSLGDRLTDHPQYISSMAFSPDGRVLTSASGPTIRLWDVDRASPTFGQPLGTPLTGQEKSVMSVVFSPDGRLLAAASMDHKIWLWDLSPSSSSIGESVGLHLGSHDDSVNVVAFSPDGQVLASGSWDQTIRLWAADPSSANFGQALGAPLEINGSAILELVFSPNGQILASASIHRMIRLWDVDPASPTFGQRLSGWLTGHDGEIIGLAFSPDGSMLASVSINNQILIWDVSKQLSAATENGQP